MVKRDEFRDEWVIEQIRQAAGDAPQAATERSRRHVREWFERTAPLIEWDVLAESPLGPIYVAASSEGLCSVDFGVTQAAFLDKLDRLARTRRNSAGLEQITGQLREYFAGRRQRFDLPLDLARLTPFHRSVLQTIRSIPTGSTWTYGQVAQALGKPGAGRAVGQALGRNPVPIVIPCHRVVAGNGQLGGYSGGGGLDSKRLLLHLEGAL